ncbi:MAG: hypothetical protein ABR508_00630 [Candidatus Baltobacteraceae bacterium]
MWAAAGLALSLSVSLIAFFQSRRAAATYYEGEVYGMTPAVHRRYAAVALAFAGGFTTALLFPTLPVAVLMGGYVIFMVFYLSSFARGFGE